MIEYLRIEGFKSIKKMELELKPVNILIGSNGSGKSNFISFFKLVLSVLNTRLQRYVSDEGTDNLLYFGSKKTENIKSKIVFSHPVTVNHTYSFILGTTKTDTLLLDYETSAFNSSINDSDFSSNYLGFKESYFASGIEPENIVFQSYATNLHIYHFNDTSFNASLRKKSDVADNGYLKPDGRNLPAFFYLIQQNHPKVYNRIVKTIQSVAPYIDRFILEPSRLSGRQSEIELRWVDSNDPESNFSAYQLSDGTLRFIALATLLMQPEPPKVIIIDEPELGLHPFAIGKLAGMVKMAASKAQIIAATQSPGFISHFLPEDIVVADKSAEEKQSIFNRLDAESLETWLKDYSLGDLWERNIINAAQPFTQ